LDDEVRAALEALPDDIQAKLLRISWLIESAGLAKVHEPYVKHLEGEVWEMRMKGKTALRVQPMSRRPAIAWSWCMCSSRRPRKRRAAKSKQP